MPPCGKLGGGASPELPRKQGKPKGTSGDKAECKTGCALVLPLLLRKEVGTGVQVYTISKNVSILL